MASLLTMFFGVLISAQKSQFKCKWQINFIQNLVPMFELACFFLLPIDQLDIDILGDGLEGDLEPTDGGGVVLCLNLGNPPTGGLYRLVLCGCLVL